MQGAAGLARVAALAMAGLAAMPVAGTALAQEARAVWSVSRYASPDAGGEHVLLVYGIPETDATALVADCRPGTSDPDIDIMLMVDFGGLPAGTPVIARLTQIGQGGGRFAAAYPAEVRADSEEYAGISMRTRLDHPVWNTLAGAGRLAVSAMGLRETVIPLAGAEAKVADFLAACHGLAAPSAPDPGDVVEGSFACGNGTRLSVRFDNSGAISVAYLTRPGTGETKLVQMISGSGARYAGGGLSLHTKGGEAFFVDETGAETGCRQQ